MDGCKACDDKQGQRRSKASSAYRLLSMLSTARKQVEELIKPRVTDAIRVACDSSTQYGFNAGVKVVQAVRLARAYPRHCLQVVLLVMLYGRDAFNSAR